jgi:hypothetical protein
MNKSNKNKLSEKSKKNIGTYQIKIKKALPFAR